MNQVLRIIPGLMATISRTVNLKLGALTGSGASPATNTWQYDTNRGWLQLKGYPRASDGAATTNGPVYGYTDAGRLQSRLWHRGVTTTYAYNTGGDLMVSPPISPSVFPNVTAAWSAPEGCTTGVAPQNPILADALPPICVSQT
jgi:hypothetical protein